MKEVKLKCVAGPFDSVPYENYIQSPIGLVPKAGGAIRLIFHLSYDCKRDGLMSLNHHTPKEMCSVSYRDLDYAVHAYLNLAQEMMEDMKQQEMCQCDGDQNQHQNRCLRRRWKMKFCSHNRIQMNQTIFAGKSDLKSAFRILGLSRDSWKWLVMKAQDPASGEWKFFIDKCLPFGASISCSHFQRFSNALCHLIEYKLKVNKRITNYLDDFLFLARTILKCNYMIQQFLDLCDDVGVPVSMEKTEWGSQLMTFLGILLDGKRLILSIPIDKKEAAIHLLNKMLHKKKATVKELQSLCGFLNFFGQVIYPRRMFTRRMYAKYSLIINNTDIRNGQSDKITKFNNKIRQHHHVWIDSEFKLDCSVWLQFLEGPLAEVVNRPMVDWLEKTQDSSNNIGFFSDASAAEGLGFGAILKNRWVRGDWPDKFIKDCKPSIEFLELYALCIGLFAWKDSPELKNGRVRIHCDNQAVVHMINNLTSSCKHCMLLIRLIVLNSLKYSYRLTACYINTKLNGLSDALSRNQMTRFRRLGPAMLAKPDDLPEEIWPIYKVWQEWTLRSQ